ncbi:MAG: hypothetical protein RR257_05655, partial [Rikenellaceae bacterium]
SLIIAFFVIPDVSELPFEFIITALYIAPLVIGVSFSIDLLVSNRKWVTQYKALQVIIIYSFILGYLILNFKWVVVALEAIIDINYWQNNLLT